MGANVYSFDLAPALVQLCRGTAILQYKWTEDNWPHILEERAFSAPSISLPPGTKEKATDYYQG